MNNLKNLLFAMAFASMIPSAGLLCSEQSTAIQRYFNTVGFIGLFPLTSGLTLARYAKSLIRNGYSDINFNKMPKGFRTPQQIKTTGLMQAAGGLALTLSPVVVYQLELSKQSKPTIKEINEKL